MRERFVANRPEDTFEAGERLGGRLNAGDLVLLTGGLGAGKTLFTKGVLSSLGFPIDEVTSPSFALVNLYPTEHFDVYHIDLWRLDNALDPAEAVGLDEILAKPNVVTIIEWAERLKGPVAANRIINVAINGDGDDPRNCEIEAHDRETAKI